MFKVSNRNTRKRCLLISKKKKKSKTSERRHLTSSYLLEVTSQNHILESFTWNIYQYMSFYEKWETITEIFDSRKIQNVSIFDTWKSSAKNGQIFQLFTVYSKGSITKLDILIFCNKLHLDFWNLSWKRIVFS